MSGYERVMLSSAGHLVKPAWAPPFPAKPRESAFAPAEPEAKIPADPGPPPPQATDPWVPPGLHRNRPGPSRLIAFVEASPSGAELLAAAVAQTAQARGDATVALAVEPRGRLAAISTRVPVIKVPPDVGPDLLTARLTDLQRRADLLVVDLGCRWVPALFRPVLSRATEIWLVGQIGQWGALEARQSQAEFSGWTDLDRIHLFALGPPGTAGPASLGEPITILEATEPSLTSFAESYWRRHLG